jgi:S-layer protein
LADATGTGDVLNLSLSLSTANMDHGTVAVAGVETINLTASDTATTIQTHSVQLNAAASTSIVVNGNANLTLSPNSTTPALSSLDASTLSGGLTASTNGTVAQRITGGSGADVLTARGDADVLIGGAGNDRLNTSAGADLVVLTGGAGTDAFGVGFAPTNVSSYATITDLSAGESLVFSAGAASFSAAQITLAPTAVFQDYANAAINNSATGAVTWFQFGGDTYIVEKVSGGSVFVNGTDIIVKISGLVNLSGSSFSSSSDTLIYRPTP